MIFSSKSSVLLHEEATGGLYAIAVTSSALANSRGAVNWDTHTCSQRKPFPCLSPHMSAFSREHAFMAQEMECPDGAHAGPR